MANFLDTIEQSLSPKKVGIVEFAESSDFCNKTLYPRQEVLLKLFFLEELTGPEEDILDFWINGGRHGGEVIISPDIRERAEWLRENDYPHFREVVLVGGRRSSKGFVTGLSMAKVMWDCLQLGDPGNYYGIDVNKEIQFSCVAGSEEQAKEYQYQDLSTTIEDCKAFSPYIIKSLETEIRVATDADLRKITQAKLAGNKSIQKDIARLRGKALAANAGTLRGSATMAMCIDEMAHMIPGESKAAADKVYEAAEPSMAQFGSDAILFCNSSPYTKVGMFYDRYVAGMRRFDPTRPLEKEVFGGEERDEDDRNGNPALMMFEFPSWAFYEGYQKSKKPIKHVLMGSPDWDENEVDEDGNKLWNATDIRFINEARAAEAENPEAFKVERRGMFAEVTDAFLNPRMVDRMYKGIPGEFVFDADHATIPRRELIPIKTNWGDKTHTYFRYKFHIDPSKTDAGFGFAIAHTEFYPKWDGGEEEHVVFDVVKRWMPREFGSDKIIKWAPILAEIERYAEIFYPFEITMDQHQSAEPIQLLQESLTQKNIVTRVYEKTATNELNWKRWEVFKTALYQGLVHAPFDTADLEYSSQELKFLQQTPTGGKFPRIDRQELGPVQTKDMADCICECTYALLGNLFVNRTRENLSNASLVGGAQGGYGIGNFDRPGYPQGGPSPENAVGGMDQWVKVNESKDRSAYNNPSRGVVSRGRGRGGRNRSRGW